jgi:hypothetical protein
MCKGPSLHAPIRVDSAVYETPRNVEDVEQHEEVKSDNLSNFVILLCVGILSLYFISGMPCACSFHRERGMSHDDVTRNVDDARQYSLRGASFMMIVQDASVEESDESHHQAPHRHPESFKNPFGPTDVQFNLKADTPHDLSSSDTDASKDLYSSETDSQEIDLEKILKGEIGLDEGDMRQEESGFAQVLNRRSIQPPMEASVAGSWPNEEPEDSKVDSSSLNDDFVAMIYDEVEMISLSDDENPKITNPVVKRRSILDSQN